MNLVRKKVKMDLYIKRDEKVITLQEWIDYVKTDNDLILAEAAEGMNPITKEKLRIEIPGRVIFNDNELHYKNGCIGCEYSSDTIVKKLKEIADTLNADLFDCGYRID